MLKTLLLQNRWALLLATVLTFLSASTNVLLLHYLNGQVAAHRGQLSEWLPAYLIGVAALFGLSLLSNGLMVWIASRTIATVRTTLVRGVLATHYPKLEATGKGPLLGVMTEDVENVTEGLSIAPQFVLNLVTILACCSYLAYLSLAAFLWFGGAVALGAALTYEIVRRGHHHYDRFRRFQDIYYEHLHTLFDGAKELATNIRRRTHFTHQELLPSIGRLKRLQQRWDVYWHLGEIWTKVLLFVALAVALAAIQQAAPGNLELAVSYFVTITFLAGAIDFVVHGTPSLSKARLSARIIDSHEWNTHGDLAMTPDTGTFQDWQRMEFAAVTYQARYAQGDAFQLGPISLTLQRGETIFLVGGNGSGKSTFAKVMNGLYRRSGGDIRIDGQWVDADTPMAYRSLFSTIYADYHLFGAVLDHKGDAAQDRLVQQTLTALGFPYRLQLKHSRWSTTAASQGQRKWLALIQAWLDDATIYVLDEWAADQDPIHRAHFYERILPAMKARGKTLVVITHDERYYHLADRIYRFEAGQCTLL